MTDIADISSDQPTINIGTLGSVSNGKSTIIKSLTGIATQKYTKELESSITIKLGYANCKIFKCNECPKPTCYQSFPSHIKDPKCHHCDNTLVLKRHISFVDCPGHHLLMSTMLNGTAIMDGAIFVISAAEHIPQPQTAQHMTSANIMGLNDLIVCLNKLDIPKTPAETQQKYKDTLKFLKNTVAQNAPIIPMSASQNINLDVLSEYLCTQIPEPQRDLQSPPKMIVVRSFDINKQYSSIEDIKGGIAGGSLIKGTLSIGDQVEIRPGAILKNQDGSFRCIPIKSRILSLKSEKNKLTKAFPGGLIAVGLDIDPGLTISDHLVGQTIGIPGHMPDITVRLKVTYNPIEEGENFIIKKGRQCKININASNIDCEILKASKSGKLHLKLEKPICVEENDKISISLLQNNKPKLTGWGSIYSFEPLD